uniref:Eukaryotic translation initiation factor 3 subunit K n=1 Tax=Knipowitschia caucasica TaxID=637954 RepID=A0AAV2J761_KNICA
MDEPERPGPGLCVCSSSQWCWQRWSEVVMVLLRTSASHQGAALDSSIGRAIIQAGCGDGTLERLAEAAVEHLEQYRRRYQFNPAYFQTPVTSQILLKALTNLPHTDFTLCKCMIDQTHQEERPIRQILYLGNLLETCHFQSFWTSLEENRELIDDITGFEDSVRKFICHVVGITYQTIDRRLLAEMLGDPLETQVKQWMNKYSWTEDENAQVFVFNQEESVKPKNIVEKIDFESVSSIMATSQ